jgi:hypothetical protein
LRALALAAVVALVACDAPESGPPPGAVNTEADAVRAPERGGDEAAPPDAPAGSVQVIVRLRFDAPAGAAPDSEAYKAALVRAREAFLGSIGGIPHRVVRTYDTLPLVVLSVPAEQRAELERSPLVASVEDDRLNAPLAH